ncbi:hypothetical protein LR48_Vigan03g015700 [Vigna angularis]|uniref:Uncharacterized protein n=1 Tax=Phaseolus angularis TaxID=3914 RepID=A0A0L9U1Y0_PHAAN|nr:hypothetical protein LR48_Vigan03g015700 [Vigna angularis]
MRGRELGCVWICHREEGGAYVHQPADPVATAAPSTQSSSRRRPRSSKAMAAAWTSTSRESSLNVVTVCNNTCGGHKGMSKQRGWKEMKLRAAGVAWKELNLMFLEICNSAEILQNLERSSELLSVRPGECSVRSGGLIFARSSNCALVRVRQRSSRLLSNVVAEFPVDQELEVADIVDTLAILHSASLRSRVFLSTKPHIRPSPSPAIGVAVVQPRRRPQRANPQAVTQSHYHSAVVLHGCHDHHLHLLRHEHIHGRQPKNEFHLLRHSSSPTCSHHRRRGKLKQIEKQNSRRGFHPPLFSTVTPATAFQPSSITITEIAPPSPKSLKHAAAVARVAMAVRLGLIDFTASGGGGTILI